MYIRFSGLPVRLPRTPSPSFSAARSRVVPTLSSVIYADAHLLDHRSSARQPAAEGARKDAGTTTTTYQHHHSPAPTAPAFSHPVAASPPCPPRCPPPLRLRVVIPETAVGSLARSLPLFFSLPSPRVKRTTYSNNHLSYRPIDRIQSRLFHLGILHPSLRAQFSHFLLLPHQTLSEVAASASSPPTLRSAPTLFPPRDRPRSWTWIPPPQSTTTASREDPKTTTQACRCSHERPTTPGLTTRPTQALALLATRIWISTSTTPPAMLLVARLQATPGPCPATFPPTRPRRNNRKSRSHRRRPSRPACSAPLCFLPSTM